jgi:CheY-like chemotaxis protein
VHAFSEHDPAFRILVAEDNAINQKVLDLMLRSAGFEADIVSDGAQALQAQRSKPYDLILMDLQMPVMDGWEATHQIRQLQERRAVIVAVTAEVLGGIRKRCLEAGMDDYLAKPFTREQLLNVVKGAYERLKASDTISTVS